ncbi:MAG TPA: hypothetical protein PK782_14345 [Nitrospira sp.]|jgi:hypothetical protein|nr:hypothetical protein [Nitrospira sp.]HNC78537.1 hypothetical protein [Rhodocyclaceae bacterium]HND03254.1 hypothetical protein [Nitrospira sp.]HNG03882.1 hypothetical protein [Nitrospira sp.]HNG53977.1 hypothetical protein [Nitrospira sp.]
MALVLKRHDVPVVAFSATAARAPARIVNVVLPLTEANIGILNCALNTGVVPHSRRTNDDAVDLPTKAGALPHVSVIVANPAALPAPETTDAAEMDVTTRAFAADRIFALLPVPALNTERAIAADCAVTCAVP